MDRKIKKIGSGRSGWIVRAGGGSPPADEGWGGQGTPHNGGCNLIIKSCGWNILSQWKPVGKKEPHTISHRGDGCVACGPLGHQRWGGFNLSIESWGSGRFCLPCVRLVGMLCGGPGSLASTVNHSRVRPPASTPSLPGPYVTNPGGLPLLAMKPPKIF